MEINFSAYNLLDTFTLHDAAYLLSGHEPLAPTFGLPKDDPHEIIRYKASTIADQLINDAKNGNLKAVYDERGGYVYISTTKWTVTRQALREWAITKDIRPIFLFPDDSSHNTRSTWGQHTTDELEILKEAIQKFWEEHDPKRPPKKDIVVSWLMQKGLSQRIAQAMDTIMRTPEARKGGNKSLSS